MAEQVFALPDLGEGLEEGEIVAWLVAEGDAVELNQPLVEIVTAKATVEIPSPYVGTIARLHAAAGASVPVGSPLVTFEVEGPERESPVAPVGVPEPARAAATPAVRKLAKDLGVDLSTVAASSDAGRISAQDVRRAAEGSPPDDADRTPLTPTRRAIAANLERQAAIPQVTTFRTVDATALQAFRMEREVSPLPVLVAALVGAVRDHPLLNATWAEDAIAVHRAIHVGIAADTERGLVVPVLRDAGSRGIGGLAIEIGRLAAAAREGTLSPGDLTGATIAVSNTGSYGSEAGTPILSPGTSVTVAMGRITQRALVVDDAVTARPALTLSITFDHRVLDGGAVGRAANQLVAVLENPDALRDLPA